MITPDGRIWVIDCAFYSGDPWIEFWEISGDADEMPQYYTGLIKGYFDGEPPAEYFPLLALYMVDSYLEWGYDPKCVLDWFDDMRNPVPTWYPFANRIIGIKSGYFVLKYPLCFIIPTIS